MSCTQTPSSRWFVDCSTDSEKGQGSKQVPQQISKESVNQSWLPTQPVKENQNFHTRRLECKVRAFLSYLKKQDEPKLLEQTCSHVSGCKGFPVQNQAVRSGQSFQGMVVGERNEGLEFGSTTKGSANISVNASFRLWYFAITTQRA